METYHLEAQSDSARSIKEIRTLLRSSGLKWIREREDGVRAVHFVFNNDADRECAQRILSAKHVRWVLVDPLLEPSLYTVFQLNPSSGTNDRGCDILFPMIDENGVTSRKYAVENTPAFDDNRSVWIASPYLNGFAFEWLKTVLPERQKNPVFIVTSEDNNPIKLTGKRPSTTEFAVQKWQTLRLLQNAIFAVSRRTNGGPTYLKAYPSHRGQAADIGAGDRLMHRKLYLSVIHDLTTEGTDLLPFKRNYGVHDAYFGSCNFTGAGLGYKKSQYQGYEFLAEAKEDRSRQRLKMAFLYTWNLNYKKHMTCNSNLWKWVYNKYTRPFPTIGAPPCKLNGLDVETANGDAIWRKI